MSRSSAAVSLEQVDLFAVPAPVEPSPKPPTKVARNALSARPDKPKERKHDETVLHHVKANGMLGITRNELHEKTGFSIQTLSWSLGHLLESRAVFRRLDTTARDGRRRFVSRGRCYVVYAALYHQFFSASEHPPCEPQEASDG